MAKLANVNTTDIKDAIALGCRTMQSVFNADDNNVPFFATWITPRRKSDETRFAFNTAVSESHVPGRHLNALLNAEDVAGVDIDEQAIENHANALFLAHSGPLKLSCNRGEIGGPLKTFGGHNTREAFHGLYALVKYRDHDQARRTAQVAIETFFDFWDPVRGWDLDRIRALGIDSSSNDFIGTVARTIGPLIKYFRATGEGRALELAIKIKEKVIGEYFLEDGAYRPGVRNAVLAAYPPGEFTVHTHSVTCTMSSLAQLADLTSDSVLMNRVRAFYDNGLWDMRDQLGWVVEIYEDDFNHDRGELNNTGDIVETALILGRWGYTQYFEDAERIVRSHLLPSQLRDNSFIIDPPNPDDEDTKRDVADRHLGAFGFPAPYGHFPVGHDDLISFNLDIVGGAVGSLCDVLREATRFDAAGHWVNLLFDHETDAIQVESPYTQGRLRVTVKRPGPLHVRVPSWVDRNALTLDAADAQPLYTNGYLFFAAPTVAKPITIGFDLPTQQLVLKHRDRNIRVRMRGDEVVAMDNFGADLTFFDPYES